MAIDPVCGKQVDEQNAPAIAEYEGHEYFFDSEKCKQEFNAHPDRYSGEGWTPGIQYPE